jgi:hypothetical protein
MVYGDNWIAINAKKKALHEQYLRILMENHDKIVDDVATYFGTKYPHITTAEQVRLSADSATFESIKDLKAKLNASAPEGGHKDHLSAIQSISGHLEDNYALRTALEERHLHGRIDPKYWDDEDLSPHYPDYFSDVAGELSKKNS